MGYAEDMCDIVVSNAGDLVRFFVHVDPQARSQEVLYAREDLEWTATAAEAVDEELQELVAKKSYEAAMDAGEVTQLIKVADEMVAFTGFMEDKVVVVTFERGIFGELPGMVAAFREYMIENDIDFTELAIPE